MPKTFEEAELPYLKARIPHTSADIFLSLENDLDPNETPLQRAARRSAQREAAEKREAADSAESHARQRRREALNKKYPGVLDLQGGR